MDSHNNMLGRYIQSGRVFTIPVYQRTYDWHEEQCRRLFDDMLALYGQGSATHFIGTICVKWNASPYDIIVVDGQQRITTIMLMYLALRNLTDDERMRKQILGYYLVNEYDEGDSMHYRLVPVERDFVVWKKLIDNAELGTPLDLTDEERGTRIWQNYELFYDLLQEAAALGHTWQGIKEAIDRLEIVTLELKDENPQVIFESLNSTGLDLSVTDLIRNYFLMDVEYEDQKRLYHRYWAPMERLLGDKIERFFIDYVMVSERKHVYDAIKNGSGKSKGINITGRNLYKIIKDKYPSTNARKGYDTETVLADLYRYAEYYSHIVKPAMSDSEFEGLTPAEKAMYQIEHRIPSGNATVFLLYLYSQYADGKMTDDQHADACKAVLSYCVRSRICSCAGMTAQRAALAIRHFDDYDFEGDPVGTVWSILDDGRGKFRFPTDKEFAEQLTTIPIYTWLRAKGTYFILYSIESRCKRAKELPAYSVSSSIEHVFPQSPDDKWLEYARQSGFDDYEEKLHTIGNLTLTGYNSELGRKPFSEKAAEYQNSSYVITRNVTGYQVWDGAAIDRRAGQLANVACHVWPKREGAAKRARTGVTCYDLATDENELTGKKLHSVSFNGEAIEIGKWKQLAVEVARRLYEQDNETFEELAENPSVPQRFLVQADANGNFPKGTEMISERTGILIHANTTNIIQFIRAICRHYDLKLGTDFYDNLTIDVMERTKASE